jgi:hypothetical protein
MIEEDKFKKQKVERRRGTTGGSLRGEMMWKIEAESKEEAKKELDWRIREVKNCM